MDPSIRELADVVGRQPLEHAERVPARDVELAHVRDVEEPDALAHGAVLLEDAGVLDGHLPAAEVDQLRAELAVQVVERRALERGGAAAGAAIGKGKLAQRRTGAGSREPRGSENRDGSRESSRAIGASPWIP